MNCANDKGAGAAADFDSDIAVACGKAVVAELALVDIVVVHKAVAAANGMMDETSGMAYSVAQLFEHARGIWVKQDFCRFLIVADRTVRAAEGQVVEAVRQDIRSDFPQVVWKSSVFVGLPDCAHVEVCNVWVVGSRLVMVVEAGRLIHDVVTSLLLYSPRLISEVLVEVYLHLASQ